jgi:carboxyl-terminal processing protease
MVVLVDGGSASASELVAGALQAYGRAILVGAQTFGKGSFQNVMPLDPIDLGAIKVTGGLYYLPNGESPQNAGISPDVEIAGSAQYAYREADRPLALPAARTSTRLAEPFPLMPGREALVRQLNERAAARRAAMETPASGGGNQDPAMEEALAILADLARSLPRDRAQEPLAAPATERPSP